MVRDPSIEDETPDIDAVLGALHDEDCRAILTELGDPRTARSLLDRCDIPRSTLYRKLERLSEATLVSEGTQIREDGSHATRYRLNFEDVVVTRTGSAGLEVEIDRPVRNPDERLAEMWSEVQKEL
jgi:DNA-binding transcriptional ArsR family regulator